MSPHRRQRAHAPLSCTPPGTGRMRPRPPRGAGAAVLALLAAVLVATALLSIPPAQAVLGDPDGGIGRYQQNIDWIDWTDGNAVTLNRGESRTRWTAPVLAATQPAVWRSSQCTISEVSNALSLGYDPGTWSGDGLSRLYNNGANFSQGQHHGSTRSGLPIGIANARHASLSQPETVTFTVTCRSYLLFSPSRPEPGTIDDLSKQEIPIAGLVIADAESSNWNRGTGESVTVHSETGRYRLLESARSSQCTTTSRGEWSTFTDATGVGRSGLRLRPDGSECSGQRGWGPTSIILADGASTARVEILATGRTAAALGVVSAMDFGDAPESYGAAGAAFQPSWTGGLIGTDIRTSWEGWFTSSFNLTAASTAVAGPPATRLGAATDSETGQLFSPDALGDDKDSGSLSGGGSDEDGVVGPVDILATPGSPYYQEVACTGPGQVRGWIDWNRDGSFDPVEEASTQVDCRGSSATIEWSVPVGALRSVVGEGGSAPTYMRLRISDDKNGDGGPTVLAPTGVTGSGEVEDHRVSVFVPALTLLKKVDGTAAGGGALEADQWELSATPEGGGAPVLSGAGGVEQTPLSPGTYTLTERSDHPMAAGYQPQGWTCYQTPGTIDPDGAYSSSQGAVSAPGQTSATVVINNHDRVTCEITNTAVPANLTWSKTDEDGEPLGGSQWSLTPVDPQGEAIEVADCVTVCAEDSADTDPQEGRFRVTGLDWGRYSLAETAAPAGYNRSTETKQATIDGSTPGLTADLGAIVNSRITATVTWRKTDEDGELLEGSQWSLTPVDPQGQALEITDCVTVCAEDSADTDPQEGVLTLTGVPYGTYSLTETQAPTGYNPSEEATEVAVITHDETVSLGDIVNTRITGTVTWRKVDEHATPLSGSRWTLTPEDPQGRALEITDCVTVCAEDSLDTDPGEGAFTLKGLPYGTYSLVESDAPAGYRLDSTPRAVSVTTHGETVDLGDIVNSKSIVPGIPLTGGRGAHLFLIAGAGACALAALTAVVRRRRRRASQD